MCGIVALLLQSEQASPILVDCLTTLQHRGQDAAGIATSEGCQINLFKSNGQVSDLVDNKPRMNRLSGKFGIGHVRYPTAGSSNEDEAQPFYTNCPFGLALAHNGNLTNTKELKRHCRLVVRRQVNTGSDSEVILAILADELFKAIKRQRKMAACGMEEDTQDEQDLSSEDESLDVPHPTVQCVFEAVSKCMKRFSGGYAVVVLINGLGVVGFRDPHGIRPLSYGSRPTPSGRREFIMASESVAIEIPGFKFERDLAPGECVLVDRKGNTHFSQCAPKAMLAPCVFEYVYFARQDSVIDGVSVYRSRVNMGTMLAKRIQAAHPDAKIDVVVPVPATSRISAIQCAITLGVPYEEGLVRNRYSQRTFIMPGQEKRAKSVRLKLNPVSQVIRGRSVLLVDDSIVRGTTSRHIVEMVRNAGASHVYFASAAPPIRYPNVYGIDMPTQTELIAHNRDEEDIAAIIKADWVCYQTLEDLLTSVQSENPNLKHCDTSCFDGKYVAGALDASYFEMLHAERNDAAKHEQTNGIVTKGTRSGSFVMDDESALKQMEQALQHTSLASNKKEDKTKKTVKLQHDSVVFRKQRNLTPSSSSIADF